MLTRRRRYSLMKRTRSPLKKWAGLTQKLDGVFGGDEPQREQLPESAVPRALAEAHVATFDPVDEPEQLNRIRDHASHRGALLLV